MTSMEIDTPAESNNSTPGMKENGFHLWPVSSDESGEGLPYAPINWPNPGDNWRWRVGKRVASTGHYLDRYLYLPKRISRCENSMRKIPGFASKLSVARYIREEFPGADVDAFFASFSWRIPAKMSLINGNVEGRAFFRAPSDEIPGHSLSDSSYKGPVCKAGNKMCSSLLVQSDNQTLATMSCDLCCCEPRFCRDCCCILCCKTITLDHRGYSYIKCEAIVHTDCICGHVAHVNCALRSYMAGTVGGSIGLDAEYYCRRCDARKDLVPHVTKLLETCSSIDSREVLEKILNVGFCILRGSQRTVAKGLLNRIELAIRKLKCGTNHKDLWKVEDNNSDNCSGVSNNGNGAPEVTGYKDCSDVKTCSSGILSISSDYHNESLKLEDEIDQVLQNLRKSQESEYRIAEERLYDQKEYLHKLYHQLDKERSELSRRTSKSDHNALLSAALNRVDQIKREVNKLKEMEEVANGFGRTSKTTLKEFFGLDIED